MQNYQNCFLEDRRLIELSSSRTFCAGDSDSGIYRVNSGSGLFIDRNGVFYLRGIVMMPLLNEQGRYISKYNLYTNACEFTDWIKGKTTRVATGTYKNIFSLYLAIRFNFFFFCKILNYFWRNCGSAPKVLHR